MAASAIATHAPLFRPSIPPNNSNVEIARVSTPQGKSDFTTSSLAGFACNGRPTELLHLLAQCAARQLDTATYLARIDGRVAGGAGVAFLGTPRGAVAQLHISSTAPGFQGQGVQSALLGRRLEEAKKAGVGVAVVNTIPWSASERNVGRIGFRKEYRRGTWVRD
ncbi:hypothetical protein BJX64DRAFT_294695 [Aspergillus heterothallicus]